MNPWKVEDGSVVFACGCRFEIIKTFPNPAKMPGIKFDPRNTPFCTAVKELFASGKTKGIFQLEKQLGQTWSKKLKPENKEQVSALISVIRPGTLKSKNADGVSMTQQFCDRKNGKSPVEPYHPVVDDVLKDTFGIPCYQEQNLKLAVECANYSPNEADSLRRCLTGDTRFLTLGNGWMTVDALLEGEAYKHHKILVGQGVYGAIEKIWPTGERPVKRVTVENGMGVRATKNHEFLTDGGWKRREDLSVGDLLAAPRLKQADTPAAPKFGDEVEATVRRSRGEGPCSRGVRFADGVFADAPSVLRFFSVSEAVKFERGIVRLSSNSLELLWATQLMLEQIGIKSAVEDFSCTLSISGGNSLGVLAQKLKFYSIANTVEARVRATPETDGVEMAPSFSKIIKIHGGNERVKVYDFTMVNGDAPFAVANGLVVHNSMGKKDAQEMAKNRVLFISKAKEAKVVSEEQAAELFDGIEKSNRYVFNRCLSNDTKIMRVNTGRSSGDFTVEEMYKIRTDIRYADRTGHSVLRRKYMRLGYGLALSMCPDGRVRPNNIVDIRPAGLRAVYKLTLADGATISVTDNHKFPTTFGEKRLDELAVGQEIFTCDKAEYSALTSKIVSIEPDGECETYDVEMGAPYHNFVVSTGIVTSNSHGWSYGLRSIKTAYLKSHFPLAFFANWLKLAHEKQKQQWEEEESYELVQDAKYFGVDVMAPDIRCRNVRVAIVNEKPVFGLADVDGVGEGVVEGLMTDVEKAEVLLGKYVTQFNWPELLLEVLHGHNSKAMNSLACVGAFGWTGVSRLRQCSELAVLNRFKTKKTLLDWIKKNREHDSLVDILKRSARMKKDGGGCHNQEAIRQVMDEVNLLENPPTPEIDIPRIIAEMEEKYLGVAVTYSMLDGCDLSGVTATCAELAAGEVDRGAVGAIVTSARPFVNKSGRDVGRERAYLALVDQSGTLQDIVVFSDLYEEHKSILRDGNALLLNLEVGRNGGFIVKSLSQL